LEGELREGAHRRRDRGARGSRTRGADLQLDDAHLPDRRCGASDRCRGHGVRLPGRELRHRDRGGLARPGRTEENIAWVRRYYEAVAPHSEEGGYVNFMAGDDQDRVRANYRGNYERLVQIKQAYDPGNLFHLNQNIQPSPSV